MKGKNIFKKNGLTTPPINGVIKTPVKVLLKNRNASAAPTRIKETPQKVLEITREEPIIITTIPPTRKFSFRNEEFEKVLLKNSNAKTTPMRIKETPQKVLEFKKEKPISITAIPPTKKFNFRKGERSEKDIPPNTNVDGNKL